MAYHMALSILARTATAKMGDWIRSGCAIDGGREGERERGERELERTYDRREHRLL